MFLLTQQYTKYLAIKLLQIIFATFDIGKISYVESLIKKNNV